MKMKTRKKEEKRRSFLSHLRGLSFFFFFFSSSLLLLLMLLLLLFTSVFVLVFPDWSVRVYPVTRRLVTEFRFFFSLSLFLSPSRRPTEFFLLLLLLLLLFFCFGFVDFFFSVSFRQPVFPFPLFFLVYRFICSSSFASSFT